VQQSLTYTWSKRARVMSIAALVSALAVSACGSSSSNSSAAAGGESSQTGSAFTVLQVIDTSGPTKAYGVVDEAAMKASATYWNQHGGILGHPIKITVIDDNGDESTAVSATDQYLASHPKPDMIFAGTSGVDSGGLIPLVKRDGLLDVAVDDGGSVCAKNAQSTCPTAFVPVPTTQTQLQSVANWFKSHGFKKVGILQEEDAFSESETPPLVSELKAAGIGTDVVSFPATSVDVTPQLSELQSAGVDAIYAEALGAPAGYEAAGRARLGLVTKIPLIFDAGAASIDLTKLVPAADLKNSYEEISRSSDPHVTMPGRTLLIKYGGKAVTAQPMIVGSMEWQDLLLVHDAAEQAKSITVPALTNALESLPPAAQNDPLNMSGIGIKFTKDVHENVSPKAVATYEVVPTGPIVNGLVHYQK
jgi:Periplasmic binding protein